MEEATRSLEQQGMTILELKAQSTVLPPEPQSKRPAQLRSSDQLNFFTQLEVLVESGLPITTALETVTKNSSPELTEASTEILTRVEGGHSISRAVAATERFHRVSVAMLRIAEETGQLGPVFARLASRMRSSLMRKNGVMSALAYPLAIGLVSALLVFFLLYFMLPEFTTTIAELGGELPWPTVVLLRIGEGPWLPLAAVLCLAGILGLWYTRDNPATQTLLEKLTYETPIWGSLMRKSLLVQLSSDLAMMTELGVPLEKAVKYLKEPTCGYYAMDEALDVAIVDLRATGEALPAFAAMGMFPPVWLHMVGVGLETGQLDRMLESYTEIASVEVEGETQTLIQMLEPMMLAVLGLLVGGIVLSAFLPMYSLIEKL